MRTTLEIEDDILLAAREIARSTKVSTGKALSDLARQALRPTSPTESRNGLPLFPVRPDSGVVTLEIVNRLRDETE